MSNPDNLELFISCKPEQMDELLTVMRSLTSRPWMFWETHYTGSFSPPEPSFDFARFEIADPKTIASSSDPTARYQGLIRWFKQKDFDALLAWEVATGDAQSSQAEIDFLLQDFYDHVAKPACEQLKLTATIGPGVWRQKTGLRN